MASLYRYGRLDAQHFGAGHSWSRDLMFARNLLSLAFCHHLLWLRYFMTQLGQTLLPSLFILTALGTTIFTPLQACIQL